MKSLTQYNLMSAPGVGSGAGSGGGRRGNTMVLVAGILVLLVIIATAFISRAQTSRMIASAQLAASKRNDTSHTIGDSLAKMIAEALFVRKIVNPAFAANNSNIALGRFDPFAVRYEGDVQIRDIFNDDYAFNHPPFQVVPFTNWPDATSFGHIAQLPSGPGNNSTIPLAGSGSLFLVPEGNPIGNPGFGDTRWLRDLEPLRIDTSIPGDNDFLRLDSFSHWRHMTNIAHANNAFRICKDISDIYDSDMDGNGGLLLELNLPVEQWLADPVPINIPLNVDEFAFANAFFGQWADWFNPDGEYFNAYFNQARVPANFYRLGAYGRPADDFNFLSNRNVITRVLADADGDGFTDSFWFLAPNTLDSGIRQIVAVSITDNSGRLNANVATRFRRDDNRILIGPNIGDPVGQAEVDLGVDPIAVAQLRQRTIGATPADLALVGDFRLIGDRDATFNFAGNDFVGFLDSLHNWERTYPALGFAIDDNRSPYGGTSMEWDFDMWEVNSNSVDIRQPENFLGAVGVLTFDFNNDTFGDLNPFFNTNLFRQSDRLRYWLNAASRPFDAKLGLTPFGTDSELELRMFESQNYPWIVSSFENVLQSNVGSEVGFQLLHGNIARKESSEYLDQLDAGELLFDARRKLTMFSSTRNDLMPPWLWWRWGDLPLIVQADAFADTTDIEDNQGNEMSNGNGNDVIDVIDRFFAQARTKLDLREPDPRGFDMLFGTPDDRFFFSGQYNFDIRLAQTLMLALTDGPIFDSNSNMMKGKSYLGDYEYTNNPSIVTGIDDPVSEVRKLAASYAANIRAYRDSDSLSTLVEAEPLPQLAALPRDRITTVIAGPETERTRFMGMEKQPFLVEAFVGHVYRTVQAEFRHPAQGINPGDNVLCADDDHNDPVLVIQIANPYDTDLDLAGFALKLLDQTSRVQLLGTLGPNEKRTYFLIDPNVAGDPGAGERWEKTLLLSDPVTGFPFTNVVDLLDPLNLNLFVDSNGVQNNSPWPATDRSAYDGKNEERSIELIKFDSSLPPGIDVFEVVVDRFDMPTSTDPQEQTGFGTSITVDLFNSAPLADCGETGGPLPDSPLLPWPNARAIDTTHMIFSTRATRAWDVDLTDSEIDPNQLKNPRFIFHDRKIVDEYINGFGYNDADFDVNFPTLWFDTAFAGIQIQTPMLAHERPRFNTRHKFYSGQGPVTLDGSGGRLENFSLQMLQKDANFDQVGELLNVWLFSHELRFIESVPSVFILDNTNPLDGGTVRTFSEYLALENERLVGYHISDKKRVNRLRILPISINAQVINPVIDVRDPDDVSDPYHPSKGLIPLKDPRLLAPDLPAGTRVLDAFVCDGFGLFEDYDDNGTITIVERNYQLTVPYGNAQGFQGKGTPGLININTATPEVVRAAPHMDLLIHSDPNDAIPLGFMPPVALPLAIVHYRERFTGFVKDLIFLDEVETGYPNGANYLTRVDDDAPLIRGDRGLASIGEVMLLKKVPILADHPPEAFIPGSPVPPDWVDPNAWRFDFASMNPYPILNDPAKGGRAGAFVSTDVGRDVRNGFDVAVSVIGDGVSEDVEEANLLFAGISNLITTRSDMFTVHFIVRSFRQNPITGIWDATDREQIVDERRYVMLVDRSEVNRPTDRPRILFFEKLPN